MIESYIDMLRRTPIYGLDYPKPKLQVELPEKYIINKGATILFWKNGEKTIVRKCEQDEFNPRLAFLTAFFQHYCGMSKNKANRYLANLQIEVEKQESKPKHMQNGFQIGDVVYHNKYGKGKVINVFDTESVSVEFDEANDKLHSCLGKGKQNHCWNCYLEDLTKEEK